MTTTLHYFIPEGTGLTAQTLNEAFVNLRRQFDLRIQDAEFEGQKGFTLSITVPESLIGNTMRHGQNVSERVRNTLEIANPARPVFPRRYAALRGPALGNGDVLLNFAVQQATNTR